MTNTTAGKFLSAALRTLSQEAHDTDGADVKTRAQCLAELVWNAALGYTKKVWSATDECFAEKPIAPQTWAINLIFDRLEGKAIPSEESSDGKPTLAKRVEKINKDQFEV